MWLQGRPVHFSFLLSWTALADGLSFGQSAKMDREVFFFQSCYIQVVDVICILSHSMYSAFSEFGDLTFCNFWTVTVSQMFSPHSSFFTVNSDDHSIRLVCSEPSSFFVATFHFRIQISPLPPCLRPSRLVFAPPALSEASTLPLTRSSSRLFFGGYSGASESALSSAGKRER